MGNAAISPVTRNRFKNMGLFSSVHVRNTIEHLIESGLIEGELADTWKERMAKKMRSEEKLKRTKERAKNGDAFGMYNLGSMYLKGLNGLEKDKKKAYKWYKKAADTGDALSATAVGVLLLRGCGVEQNPTDGLVTLVTAANDSSDGSDYACYNLGEMYFKGLYGSEINYVSAKHWLEKAVAERKRKYLADELIEQSKGWISECNAFLER